MAQLPVEYLLNKLEALVVDELKLLKGVGHEVDELKMELRSMKSFLKDADRRKDDDEGIKEWVKQVREVAYDIEDALDEFLLQFGGQQSSGLRASLKKVSSSPSRLITRHQLAKKMQSIKARVVSLKERQNRYSFNVLKEGIAFEGLQDRREAPLDEQPDLVGIDQDITKVIEWLTGGDQQLIPISLVGMGGSGKTTLAREVFNHQAVKRHFDCYAWVSVSQSFNVENILVSCIRDFYESRSEICPDGIQEMGISSLKRTLHSYLQNKRYVLVLDDVWSQNVLEKIKFALPTNLRGSKIMITTRNNEVIHPIEDRVGLKGIVHRLQPLPNETAMRLFCKKAFRDEPQNICPPHLKEVCKDLAKRCDGLPLAIVVLGGIMWRKRKSEHEWRIVHDSLSSNFNDVNHPLGSRVGSILSLSFDELPLRLKSCYLYCGVFPEDYLIKTNKLVRLWVAEGLVEKKEGIPLEEVGKQYLDELIQRSLLQTVSKKLGELGVNSCRIHDLLRELVISTSHNQNICTVLTKKSARINEKIRRLSLHNDSHEGISLSNQSASHLRSLLLFGKGIMSSFFTMLSCFRLMRVLDLEGILIEELPDALGDLIHLRYLNLRRTNIRRLPSSFGKLHNLQTLDIRETPIKSLPEETSNMKSLHCICAFPLLEFPLTFKQLVGCEMPKGICMVTDLQKLSGINATTEIVHGIGNLTKLKNLAILMVRREHASHFCASVANMKDLLTLRVAGIGEEEPLQLESLLHPPRRLEYIQIHAHLNELPCWIGSLSNLARLELTFSRLSQDPFSSLQSLPNLAHLYLFEAYDGNELRCVTSGGFPKLMELFLVRLARLESVWVEETAMPKLQQLCIEGCKEMKRVPRGIQHISTLRQLYLSEMSEELIESIRRRGGKDHSMVKHIPEIILFSNLANGRLYRTHTLLE